MSKVIRQGDVTLIKIAALPKVEAIKTNVVAHGESGNTHTLVGKDARLYEGPDKSMFAVVSSKPATLTHQEHLPITVEPGIYRVGKEQEYSYEDNYIRQVID